MIRYALVTGASRGIGRAICTELAKDGCFVIINWHSDFNGAKETLRLVQEQGGNGELLEFDVSNQIQVDKAINNWQENHPDCYIDVLVNNAGIHKDAILMDMENEEWDAVMNTNINGLFYVTRRIIPDMIMAHHGRIINISSIYASWGQSGLSNYCASKAAIEGVTRALAKEVGRKKVTVNAIAPGLIDTSMGDDVNLKEAEQFIALKRKGKPEDIAYLVAFLASEKASYISGQIIAIDGGGVTI